MHFYRNFNPRSHERSDKNGGVEGAAYKDFNPRSHERSDYHRVFLSVNWIISIHAPTRGATLKHRLILLSLLFQSTLPREERRHCSKVCRYGCKFQSTLPREERRVILCRQVWLYYFNPRSHERSDRAFILCSLSSVISIHAPTRGATGIPDAIFYKYRFQSTLPREERRRQQARALSANISIHAPTRGATYKLDGLSYEEAISIHAPTRGATHLYLIRLTAVLFQSTLPREERPTTPRCRSIMPSISIHAPTRGATAILHKKFVYFYTIPTINI